jgi:hypothetical protein
VQADVRIKTDTKAQFLEILWDYPIGEQFPLFFCTLDEHGAEAAEVQVEKGF